MRFVPCEAREFVADLDDALLIGFEEKSDISVIHNGNSFVLSCFIRRELDVGIDPGLNRSARVAEFMQAASHLGTALVFQIY